MLPSQYPEVKPYKDLTELFKYQVDMQFDDLRTILQLPVDEHRLTAGCNLAAAMIMFNLISGASVCLFEVKRKNLSRSERFKSVLKHFYPWQGEELSAQECVDCIYKDARNPLAHSFGLNYPKKTRFEVTLQKGPLSLEQILELENTPIRPTWTSSTIIPRRKRSIGTKVVDLSIPSLFWGIHRMFHALISDSVQATTANKLAGQFKNHWLTFVSDLGSGIP